MRLDLRIVGLSCALLVAPLVVSAQLCGGAASFKTAPARIGGGIEFTDGSKGYGAQFAIGSAEGLFGTAGISAVDYDDASEGSTVFAFGAGYAIPIGTGGKAEFCPIGNFSLLRGPNFNESGVTAEVSGHSYGMGGQIGGIAMSTPTMDFVPFAGAMYVNQTIKISGSAGGISASESASEDAIVLSAGAGFVINRLLTIQPQISYPINVDEANATFGVAFAFNFGGPKSSSMRRR